MYRVLICLCVTLAICLTACTKDDYEQVLAPLDTLTVPTTMSLDGDADDIIGIVEDGTDGSARDIEAKTE